MARFKIEHRPSFLMVLLFIVPLSICVPACSSPHRTPPAEPPEALDVQRLLIAPFRAASGRYEGGASVRCPVCGGVFQRGPIEAGAEDYLTRQAVAFVKGKTSLTVIPPGMAEGVRSQVLSENAGASEHYILVESGRRLDADAVLSGTVYRFRQRQGTALSVESPASVAFEMHLIRVADARLVWVGSFDETQRSLSENLFDVRTFLRRGGSWLTAEDLAVFGLQRAMSSFPAPEPVPE